MDHVCCFCSKEEEIVDHLFFECELSREVWRMVIAYCGINRPARKWSEEKALLLAHCTTNSGQ